MSAHPTSPADADDRADATLAGEYSAFWGASAQVPDLFAFLRDHPNVDREQRTRLLFLDQARRWASGEGRSVEEYLRGCPELAIDSDLVLRLLVREYHFHENSPSVTEFVDRFPLLRNQLLDQLCVIDNERTSAHHRSVGGSYDGVDETQASSLIDIPNPDETTFEAAHHDPNHTMTVTVSRPPKKSSKPRPAETVPIIGPRRLRQCFPFDTLRAELADELESHMVEKTFATGEYLIRQGDPGDSLILIRDGWANIVVADEHGVPHEIDRSGPGAILGEMALLTEAPRSANIIARETVTISILSAQTFHDYARKHPQISEVLTQLFAERLGGNRRDVLAGKTLDRYRIVRRLGRGGMAIVYEGVDDQSGRRVALKMLSHRLVYDKPSLAWFQREADIIEGFEHENIVKMSGRFHAFHSYFIVMEFCDGITLERLVRLNGPMNPNDFRKTFGQLAAALLYAHERDVIHRDLKPVNMMVNFDGMLKLMDFGLAMPLHTVPDALELDRQVVGTPRYMAPEQLMGRELTEAADYFSLGCTAYKLLTGNSLFVESDVIKLREIHAGWKGPDFPALHPEFSPEICELLTGCLHRRPEARVCDLAKYADWAEPLDVARLL
ncbi:MAG: protein kinase [Planctomycetia bacterium]|nr:protein kinase [Planctomycetia bacterium]